LAACRRSAAVCSSGLTDKPADRDETVIDDTVIMDNTTTERTVRRIERDDGTDIRNPLTESKAGWGMASTLRLRESRRQVTSVWFLGMWYIIFSLNKVSGRQQLTRMASADTLAESGDCPRQLCSTLRKETPPKIERRLWESG